MISSRIQLKAQLKVQLKVQLIHVLEGTGLLTLMFRHRLVTSDYHMTSK